MAGDSMETTLAVEPSEINALGFMLGDKKDEAFKLELEYIKVL